jgi:Rrf2 family transcriptional regulator, nitric oxide-sensitive transcriptional repressor
VISRTAEYALRAVVFLGCQAGRPATTQRIAAGTKLPAGYMAKVLQALGRSGLVDAQRGLNGGYVLARPLEELTVLHVVNAVDPLRRIDPCPPDLAEHQESLYALHRRLDEGIALIESFFEQTTVGQLLAQHAPGPQPLCAVLMPVQLGETKTPSTAAAATPLDSASIFPDSPSD